MGKRLTIQVLDSSKPETLLDSALTAVENGDGYRAELDRLPVPIYIADPDGRITYWNQACIAFAGRESLRPRP